MNTAVGPAKVKKLSYEDLFVHLQNIGHLSFSCLDSGEDEKINLKCPENGLLTARRQIKAVNKDALVRTFFSYMGQEYSYRATKRDREIKEWAAKNA